MTMKMTVNGSDRMNYNTPLVCLAEHNVLETERLILRPMTMADLADYHEYTSDADLLKYDYPAHKSLDESRYSLVVWNLSQPLGRYGIELKSEGKLIGNISLRLDEEAGKAELGYTVNARYHKQGYATEAATALRDLAKNLPGITTLAAQTLEDNRASQRVLEKLGMTCLNRQIKNSLQGQPAVRLLYQLKLK